jgi:hypothetical protein
MCFGQHSFATYAPCVTDREMPLCTVINYVQSSPKHRVSSVFVGTTNSRRSWYFAVTVNAPAVLSQGGFGRKNRLHDDAALPTFRSETMWLLRAQTQRYQDSIELLVAMGGSWDETSLVVSRATATLPITHSR